jgi:hypothetical protein
VIRHSQTDRPNPDVVDWTDRYRDADNTRFFVDAIADLDANDGAGLIGLVGSGDLPGVALRRAQSILRWDHRPSLWSHAFLLIGDGKLREVALHSRAGQFPEPADNAITSATLEHYAKDPNVALLAVDMDAKETASVIERATTQPNLERLRFDLFEILGHWQAYLWTRGSANPLEQGAPLHSSALIEYCFEAIGLDLAPGANDRNSAPEHLWNSAKWWYEELKRFGRTIAGRAVVRDPHCAVLGPGET